MAWALAISAVMNLVLVVAWMDAAEGKKYFERRMDILQGSRDNWQLRALGKEQMKSKKSVRKGA